MASKKTKDKPLKKYIQSFQQGGQFNWENIQNRGPFGASIFSGTNEMLGDLQSTFLPGIEEPSPDITFDASGKITSGQDAYKKFEQRYREREGITCKQDFFGKFKCTDKTGREVSQGEINAKVRSLYETEKKAKETWSQYGKGVAQNVMGLQQLGEESAKEAKRAQRIDQYSVSDEVPMEQFKGFFAQEGGSMSFLKTPYPTRPSASSQLRMADFIANIPLSDKRRMNPPRMENGGGNKYTTKLTPKEEQQFRAWYKKVASYKGLDENPDSPEQYYDYRGFWKNEDRDGILKDNPEVHFYDTYKQPGHPTFSTESKYSTKKQPGGTWSTGKDGTYYFTHSPYTEKYADRTTEYLMGSGENSILRGDTIYSKPKLLPSKMEEGGNDNALQQMLGYKDNSPYKDLPYQVINSNEITMDGVSKDLIGIPMKKDGKLGKAKYMKANSGTHKFPGKSVIEIPVSIPAYRQNGGTGSIDFYTMPLDQRTAYLKKALESVGNDYSKLKESYPDLYNFLVDSAKQSDNSSTTTSTPTSTYASQTPEEKEAYRKKVASVDALNVSARLDNTNQDISGFAAGLNPYSSSIIQSVGQSPISGGRDFRLSMGSGVQSRMNGGLNVRKFQSGGGSGNQQMSEDEYNDAWIEKIMDFEATKGNPDGGPMPNFGYNSITGVDKSGNIINKKTGKKFTKKDAIEEFKKEYLPKVSNLPRGVRERIADYIYNTGRNPNQLLMLAAGIITLDEINDNTPELNSIKNQYGKDSNEYKTAIREHSARLNRLWDENKSKVESQFNDPEFVGKLSSARDEVARTTKMVNGKPNPSYKASWYDRARMFDPNNQQQTNQQQTQPKVETTSPTRVKSEISQSDGNFILSNDYPKGSTVILTNPLDPSKTVEVKVSGPIPPGSDPSIKQIVSKGAANTLGITSKQASIGVSTPSPSTQTGTTTIQTPSRVQPRSAVDAVPSIASRRSEVVSQGNPSGALPTIPLRPIESPSGAGFQKERIASEMQPSSMDSDSELSYITVQNEQGDEGYEYRYSPYTDEWQIKNKNNNSGWVTVDTSTEAGKAADKELRNRYPAPTEITKPSSEFTKEESAYISRLVNEKDRIAKGRPAVEKLPMLRTAGFESRAENIIRTGGKYEPKDASGNLLYPLTPEEIDTANKIRAWYSGTSPISAGENFTGRKSAPTSTNQNISTNQSTSNTPNTNSTIANTPTNTRQVSAANLPSRLISSVRSMEPPISAPRLSSSNRGKFQDTPIYENEYQPWAEKSLGISRSPISSATLLPKSIGSVRSMEPPISAPKLSNSNRNRFQDTPIYENEYQPWDEKSLGARRVDNQSPESRPAQSIQALPSSITNIIGSTNIPVPSIDTPDRNVWQNIGRVTDASSDKYSKNSRKTYYQTASGIKIVSGADSKYYMEKDGTIIPIDYLPGSTSARNEADMGRLASGQKWDENKREWVYDPEYYDSYWDKTWNNTKSEYERIKEKDKNKEDLEKSEKRVLEGLTTTKKFYKKNEQGLEDDLIREDIDTRRKEMRRAKKDTENVQNKQEGGQSMPVQESAQPQMSQQVNQQQMQDQQQGQPNFIEEIVLIDGEEVTIILDENRNILGVKDVIDSREGMIEVLISPEGEVIHVFGPSQEGAEEQQMEATSPQQVEEMQQGGAPAKPSKTRNFFKKVGNVANDFAIANLDSFGNRLGLYDIDNSKYKTKLGQKYSGVADQISRGVGKAVATASGALIPGVGSAVGGAMSAGINRLEDQNAQSNYIPMPSTSGQSGFSLSQLSALMPMAQQFLGNYGGRFQQGGMAQQMSEEEMMAAREAQMQEAQMQEGQAQQPQGETENRYLQLSQEKQLEAYKQLVEFIVEYGIDLLEQEYPEEYEFFDEFSDMLEGEEEDTEEMPEEEMQMQEEVEYDEEEEMPEGEMQGMREGGIPQRYRNMGFSRVGQKKQSDRPGKKWMVLAKKGDQYKVVHGGAKGMSDFTQHRNQKRRNRFWDRMGGKDSAKARDPFSPLYWHKRFGTWQEGGMPNQPDPTQLIQQVNPALAMQSRLPQSGLFADALNMSPYNMSPTQYSTNPLLPVEMSKNISSNIGGFTAAYNALNGGVLNLSGKVNPFRLNPMGTYAQGGQVRNDIITNSGSMNSPATNPPARPSATNSGPMGPKGYNYDMGIRDLIDMPRKNEFISTENLIPIQAEKDELIVLPTGDVVPVMAKKRHSQMQPDEVTDVTPEGAYIISAHGKVRIMRNEADSVITETGVKPYRIGESQDKPTEKALSSIMTKSKMSPAEVVSRIVKKFPVTKTNNPFEIAANNENKINRRPYIEGVITLSEVDKVRKGIDTSTPEATRSYRNESEMVAEEFRQGGSTWGGRPMRELNLVHAFEPITMSLILGGMAVGKGINNIIAANKQQKSAERAYNDAVRIAETSAVQQRNLLGLGAAAGIAGTLAQDPTVRAAQLDPAMIRQMQTSTPQAIRESMANRAYANLPDYMGTAPSFQAGLASQQAAYGQALKQGYDAELALFQADRTARNQQLQALQGYSDINEQNRIAAENATRANRNMQIGNVGDRSQGLFDSYAGIESNLAQTRASGRLGIGAAEQQAIAARAQSINQMIGGVGDAALYYGGQMQQQPTAASNPLLPMNVSMKDLVYDQNKPTTNTWHKESKYFKSCQMINGILIDIFTGKPC